MRQNPKVAGHASERLSSRFYEDEAWLLAEIEACRFVQLKGAGLAKDGEAVRSGNLIFHPPSGEFCVAVLDDRLRLVVTVLTEEMARRSSWGKDLTDATKLLAKRRALGPDLVPDSHFLKLYAAERAGLQVNLRLRSVDKNWDAIHLTLAKITLTPDQIDIEENSCVLSEDQFRSASEKLNTLVQEATIRPFLYVHVTTTNDRSVTVTNRFRGFKDIEEAELMRRWVRESGDD